MATILNCLHCGGDLDGGDRFCARCGVESIACTECGRQLLPQDLSCPHCGTPAAPTALEESSEADSPSALADMIERLRRATLGEFDIGPELGRGGMAAVFLAHEIPLDRKVAIKVMSPGLMLGEGMIDRFKHEAITIAHLHHPNIVSVYSVRHAEGLHFFIMRYVQGRSLEQVLQQAGQLPLPAVRSILHQVGSALTYAHRSRVVHRDIKPANILLDHEGDAVVTDFGIAKAAERPSQTQTGALVGTPAYMSPEQCSGAEVSGASDQYSLGAVAYELLTGVPPFAGSTLTVMQAHVDRAPPPIRALRADCPPELEAAIHRMLEKDPGARWPGLADAMAALGAAPLAEDDPVRAELVGWITAADGALASDMPTPTSPAPRTRASSAGTAPDRPVGGISIMPAPAGLEAGDSFSLVAVIRGQHGTRLPPRAVAWSTDAPSVLRLDAESGIATALSPGAALVTAMCKGITALLRVEVAAPRADDIVIEPMNAPLYVGEEIRLDARPQDKRGWPVYRGVLWQSADPETATVTSDGAIVGRAPGTVRLTASLDDARANIVIPVLPPRVAAVDIPDPPTSVVKGHSLHLRAVALDATNTVLPGRAMVWSTSDISVAVVTSEGWVAALRPGSVVLTAMCEDVRASVRIAVVADTPAPAPTRLAEPEVRPVHRRRSRRSRRRGVLATILVLAAVDLVALYLVRTGRLTNFARTPPSAGAPAGFAAGAVGVDTAIAPIVVITPRPTRALRPDSAMRLSAAVRDAAGRPVEGAAVVWSSTDSTIARVDRASGRVVGVHPGRAQIVAANGAGRDSVVVSVRRSGARVPVVASVSIAAFGHLRVGDAAPLGAVTIGPKGDTLTGAEVTWASSNPQVASIEALTGMVQARAPGTTLIVARSGNQSALAELMVLPGTAATLQVLGARPMAVSETLALRVAARDAQGAEMTGLPVGWVSSDSTVAAVDAETGTVTALAPGSARITATAGKLVASTYLAVLPRPQRVQPELEADRQRTEAWMASGVDECYDALQSRNAARLRSVWHPTSKSDEDNLKRVSRLLVAGGRAALVGERIDREPVIGLESASMEFGVRLAWTDPSAGTRTSQPVFRAEFVRVAGRWEMSSCRLVGTLRP